MISDSKKVKILFEKKLTISPRGVIFAQPEISIFWISIIYLEFFLKKKNKKIFEMTLFVGKVEFNHFFRKKYGVWDSSLRGITIVNFSAMNLIWCGFLCMHNWIRWNFTYRNYTQQGSRPGFTSRRRVFTFLPSPPCTWGGIQMQGFGIKVGVRR